MNPNLNNDSRSTQSAILIALAVVVMVAVTGAILSATNAGQIIGFCSVIAVGLLNILQNVRSAESAANRGDEAAVKVDELAKTASETQKTAKETHIHVNSKMGAVLAKM